MLALVCSYRGEEEVEVADADRPTNGPALARVKIFEVAHRPWGDLMTSAEVDDRVYVGSREWRRQQCDNGENSAKPSAAPR
jgi:hypothetical protein